MRAGIDSELAPGTDVGDALDALRLLIPEIIGGLRRRGGVPEDIRDRLRGGAFSGRHMVVLVHLSVAGPMSVGELGERLSVTMPTVSIVVQQLAGYGLVERAEDPSDRRRAIVGIAPEHREWVEAALERRSRPLRHTLERLEPEERSTFIKALSILAEELRSQSEAVPWDWAAGGAGNRSSSTK